MVHLIAEVIQLLLFMDEDFPDNESSLEFEIFTSLVDLRPKNPSECHHVFVKPISITSTQNILAQITRITYSAGDRIEAYV